VLVVSEYAPGLLPTMLPIMIWRLALMAVVNLTY
jgi:hypothetical protein